MLAAHLNIQAKRTPNPLDQEPLPLAEVLLKCKQEDGLEKEDQPLFIDWHDESIKCRWCGLFKGSIEPRVINQHVKAAKTHLQERHRRLHPSQLIDPLEGVQDIRSYFQPS